MKIRVGAIILALVCVGLGIALIASRREAEKTKLGDTQTILTLSNNLVTTSGDLQEKAGLVAGLREDLDKQKKALERAAGDLSALTNQFTQVSGSLTETKAALAASQAEVAKRDARITELEVQNKVLDKEAIELSTSLTNLNVQIAETQRKLTASEGDRAFLEKELKRLKADKAELERQFNDLTVLRAQVSRLKEELAVSRRLELIRQGFFARFERKGAQQLMQNSADAAAKPARVPADLNVEVHADGTVKVIPSPGSTPAATNAPGK
jgi:chromosome segregation ATPase